MKIARVHLAIWKVVTTLSILPAVASPSWAQTRDKPLTVEQCQTKAKLYAKDDAVDLPTAKWLQHQLDEMHECETEIDKAHWQQYHVLVDKFLMAISLRQSSFILRHNLWAQFAAEDEAGQR